MRRRAAVADIIADIARWLNFDRQGSSSYPVQTQQDRPISEAVEDTKIVAIICGWTSRFGRAFPKVLIAATQREAA